MRAARLDFRHAITRLSVSLALGLVAFAGAAGRLAPMLAVLLAWDVAGLALLGLSFRIILFADAPDTRSRAGAEDPGRALVSLTAVLASGLSLFAAAVLVRSAHDHAGSQALHVALCLATVALAWAMTHTSLTFRYAHLYYREDAEGVGGVTFPGEQPPTYSDFAYFAFTVGMCFQVSDACVTSPQIRRTVLAHAIVSFVYNSVILAFVLNLVFGTA